MRKEGRNEGQKERQKEEVTFSGGHCFTISWSRDIRIEKQKKCSSGNKRAFDCVVGICCWELRILMSSTFIIRHQFQERQFNAN